MSCFTTVSNVTAPDNLDWTKHVNYTSGMILGVDDFTQEFGYLAGRDRWLARDAIGYGTIAGLRVTVETGDAKGPRVMIEPGAAITPRGQLVCVSAAQCAYLNQWLAANAAKLLDWIETGETSPPRDDYVRLYIKLCYRECLTDKVPVPGEPCRSESELTADSRIKDDFALELSFEPPKQPEEESVRAFVEWLRAVEIVETDVSTPLEDFIQAIRATFLSETSPPVFSPPSPLQINVEDVCEYMRTAFRLWVTELRTVLSERETGCAVEMTGGNKLSDCVLLAELRVPLENVSPGWKVSDDESVEINEENRPFLLHLRMLQELLTCGFNRIEETILTSPPIFSPPITSPPIVSPPIVSPPVTSPPVVSPHAHSLDDLSDVTVSAPSEGQILIYEGSEWTNKDFPVASPPNPSIALDELTDVNASAPADGQFLMFKDGEWIPENVTTTGGVTAHSALTGLNGDDHPQYLLASGTRAMTGNLNLGNNRITNLAAANANGQAVIFQQAIKQNDGAGGDLGGTYPNPSVVRLQGNSVSANEPGVDDILVWNGTEWTPQPQNQTEAEPFIILPLATITRLTKDTYEIWLNIDAPGNLAEVRELEAVRVLGETNSPTRFLDTIPLEITPTNNRNVFVARLEKEADYMRFTFNLAQIRVVFRGNDFSLDEYARNNNIKFDGYRGEERGFATVFVRNPNLSIDR